ncbi:MAG: ABC transporter substrate-binding protein [Coriobacteriales bacterium]|nr:ABC transporter substrate-binding protein [Coriobacteriales bacterium]
MSSLVNLEGSDFVGYDMDVMKAIGQKLGLSVEFKNLKFDAIIPAVSAGGQCDCAISGITINPERKEQVNFADGYYTDGLGFAVADAQKYTKANYNTELNKAGVMIAVQSGTTGEDYVKENFPNATRQAYDTSNDCFAALQCVAAISNDAVVGNLIKMSYSSLTKIDTISTGEEYGIAIKKDNKELLDAINKALKELKDEGKIDNIQSKWF